MSGAIEFTQKLVADIWEQHEEKAHLQECAEEIWKNRQHRGAARAAEREGNLAGYVWGKLDVSADEARVIAALLQKKMRDEAPPVLKPHARGMYKQDI